MTIGQYLGDGNPDGTTLGKSITEKVSFYGVTPVAQRASADQAAVATTGAISTTTAKWGFSTSTQANAIISLVNEMRTALVNVGIIKGGA